MFIFRENEAPENEVQEQDHEDRNSQEVSEEAPDDDFGK